MTNPDEPAEGYELAVPFVVCSSHGGPYDDQAFAAGFAAGTIDRSLTAAAAVDATEVAFTTLTTLVPQLELLAMYRGFPVMDVTAVDDTDWSTVTFTRGEAL